MVNYDIQVQISVFREGAKRVPYLRDDRSNLGMVVESGSSFSKGWLGPVLALLNQGLSKRWVINPTLGSLAQQALYWMVSHPNIHRGVQSLWRVLYSVPVQLGSYYNCPYQGVLRLGTFLYWNSVLVVVCAICVSWTWQIVLAILSGRKGRILTGLAWL